MNGPGSINRIYRLVWSAVRGAWMVVSELGRSGSRATSTSRLNLALAGLAVSAGQAFAGGPAMSVDAPASTRAPIAQAAAAALPPQRVTSPAKSALGITPSALPQFASAGAGAAAELPTGGNVVAGQATIKASAAELDITQTSQRASINWDTFNIGAQGVVNFFQPNSSAVTLNRVLDTQASRIAGRINANGQVILINPNGVVFTKDASVDVGALVATTHSLSDADFLSGSTTFSRQGATGSVVNEGRITAAAGGYVALMAPEVRNQGVVSAQMGTVAMASGERVSLRFDDSHSLAGVLVTPSQIQALVDNRSAVIAPGGQIILSAQAADKLLGGVVRNSGSLEATGLAQVAGRVMLEASDSIAHSGSINVDAQANSSGNGGKVTLIASLDNPTSRTEVSGTISARGGALGGDGGFVETSAAQVKVSEGAKVDTRAPKGKTGLWLIDPTDYTITSDSVDEDANSVRASTVNSLLALTNLTVTSGNNIVVNGSADTGGAAQITGGNGRTLTLFSSQAIDIHAGATIQGDGTPLYLILNGPSGVSVAGTINTTGGGVALNSNSASTISSGGSITTAALTTSAGSVINNGTLKFEGYPSGGASFNDNISGTGTLILNGTDDFGLGGNNTYTGATQVLSGNLVTADINSLGDGSAVTVNSGAQLVIQGNPSSPRPIGSLSGAGSVVLLNTLLVGSDGTSTTFSGVISEYGGSQSVTKVGSGTLALSGANTYTGTTTVNSGQLTLATEGALHYSSSVVVNGGVLDLGGLNQTLGNVQLSGGNIANGFLSSASAFELQSGTVSAVLQGSTAALNKTTSGTVTLSANQAYGGDTNINGGTLVAAAAQAIPTDSPVRIGNSGTLELTQALTIANLSGGGHVNLNSNTLTTGANNAEVENFYGGISGTGGLTKVGGGKFILSAYSGDNTYTGPTIVQAGTLQVNSQTPGNHAISSASAVSVSAGATLELLSDQSVGSIAGVAGSAVNLSTFTLTAGSNNTSTLFAGTMFGDGGGLTKAGSGTLTLSGASTYTGNTTISGGTLQLGNGGSTGSLSGSSNIVLQNGAALAFNRPGTELVQGADFGNSISGTGNVHLAQGSLVLGGNNTYDGSTFIQGPLRLDSDSALPSGTLLDIEGWNQVHLDVNGHHATIGALQHGSTNDGGNGNVWLGTGGSLTVSGSADTTYAGNITGSGSFVKAGTGTLTLTGASTYDGATLINGGTLLVNGPQAFPIGSPIGVGAAGTLELGQNQTIITLAGNGHVKLNSYTLTTGYGTSEGQTDNFYGLMSGTGGLTKVGGGTQALSGTSTYTGPTIVQGGTLEVSGGNALPGTSAVSISSGATLKVSSDQTIGTLAGDEGSFVNLGANTLTTGGDTGGGSTTFAGIIFGVGGGLTKYGNSQLWLTGANTYTGTTTIVDGSSSQIHIGTSGGTFGSLASAQIVNNGSLIFERSDDQSLAANISGTGSIYKAGDGILTLSGSNTYSGDTNVNGGSLNAAVAGSLSSNSAVYINSSSAKLILGADQTTRSITATGGSEVSLANHTLTVGNLDGNGQVDGAITGEGGSLVKIGTGFLNLNGTNTYTGSTTINNGWVRIGTNSTTGSLASNNIIVNDADLYFSRSDDYTYSGIISGNSGGRIIQSPGDVGSRTLTLSGANTYTGSTLIQKGTLIALGSSALGSGSAVAINNGATLSLGGSQTIGTLSGDIGSAVQLNAYTLTTGGVADTNFYGNISGSGGGLTKVGSGTLTLFGSNFFVGDTNVLGGTLHTVGGAALSTNTAVTVASGATLDVSGLLAVGSIAGSVGSALTIEASSELQTGFNNASTEFAGNISGPGNIAKGGTGVFTLSGANTYGGYTNVFTGTLLANGGSAIPNTSDVLVNPTATFRLGADETIGSLHGSASGVVDLGTHTLTTGASNASDYFEGVITGTGGLTKVGTGFLWLTGANTYTGTTTISDGYFSIGELTGATAGLSGSIASSQIVNNGSLTFARNNAILYAGNISGTGSVVKDGSGALTLSGVNTYSGSTTIQKGSLNGGGSAISSASAVSISDNASLNLSADATIASLDGAANSAVNLGANTLTTGGNNASTGFAGAISGVGGGLTKLGSGTLTLSGANTYTGTTTIAQGAISASSVAVSGGISNLGNASSAIVLGDATHTGTLNYTGGAATFTRGLNVQAGGGALQLGSTGALTVSGGGVSAGGLFTVSGNQSVFLNSIISGTGGLSMLGGGVLYLSAANTYAGATTIGAIGTIALGSGSTSGDIASTSGIANAGTLIVNRSDNLSLSGVTGGGALSKLGAGTLTLGGTSNTFSTTYVQSGQITVASTGTSALGAVTINPAAALKVGDGGTLGSISFTSLTDNGTLIFDRTDNRTFSGTISGSGSLLKLNSNTLTLTGSSTYTGTTTIAQGAISASSIVVSGGTSNLGNASSAIVLGDATNTGTLTYTGGTATFTRGLNIQAGGGGLQVNGSGGLTLNSGGVSAGGLFTVSGSQGVFLNSVVSGTGGLTVSSTNTVYFGAANTYTGTTTISAGQLQIGTGGSTGSLSTSSAIVNNGVLGFSRPTATLAQGVDFSNTISGTGGLTVWTGTVVLGGSGASNTYAGATTINGVLRLAGNNAIPQTSAVSIATGATAGLDLSGFSDSIYSLSGGGASGGGITLGAGTLTVLGAGSTTYAGAISGTGGLTKAGSGTLTLSGTSTYTGATTVQAGTLTASGGSAIADTSVVTLSSGATLGLASSETVGSLTGSTGSFVTLGANRLSTGGTDATTTFAGVISGTGGVDKLGTGDFILTSANSYTGTTTIASGGRIVVRKDAPTALSGAISGAGTLVIEPLSASFSSAVSTAGWGLSGGALANLVFGKVGNTAALTFGSATNVSNSVTAVGGSVTVSAPITATGAVNITASAPSAGGGNITVNAQVTTSTSATLQSTEASVVVGTAGGVAGLGSANVSLIGNNTGSNGSSDGVLINGGQVSTQAGIITLAGHGKALGAVANANGDGVHLVGGGVVHSSSGNINLIGTGSTTTGATTSSKGVGVLVNASDITSDTGSISLTGTGGTITPADSGVSYDARGIRLESGTVQTGGSGSITLAGYGGNVNGSTSSPSTATLLSGGVVALGTLRTADGDITLGGSLGNLTGGVTQNAGGGTRGVSIGGLVETTGTGSIHVVGSGGSSNFAAGNFGVLLTGPTVHALGSGSIDITGTGGISLSTGQSVAGVSSQSGATIQTQSGSLQLTGTQGSLPGGASDWALQLNDLTLASTSGALSLTSAGGSIGLTTATGSTVSLQTSSVASSITGQTSISGGDVSVNVGTLTVGDLSVASASSLSVTGQQLVATGTTTLAGTVKAVGGTARFIGQLNGATSGSAVVSGGTLQLNGASTLASLNQTGGAITGTGSLQVAGSFSQTAGSISGALTAVNVTQTTGNLVAGNIAASGDISLRTQAGAVNLNGVLQSSTGLVKVSAAGGNLTIGPSAAVQAQATGTAISLDTSANFVNQSTAPLALNAPNGRWLVSSTNPTLDIRGALAADFKQYNSVAAGTISGYTGPSVGNGFLYTVAPVLTAAFGASVSKTYDGNNSADVSSTPIAASGAIDGDAVQLVGSSGSFDTRNTGSLKQVSANVAINSATNGATAVLGYQLASPTVSGNVGTITGKALTISGITAANKTYDGTADALVSTAAVVKSGLVAGDTVTVNSVGSFADKSAGLGKTVTLTNTYGGTDLGNYTITGQSTTTADIAKAALTISGITAANKTYDGTTSAVVSTAAVVKTGLVLGDSVTVSSSGSFADKNAGLGKTVNLTSSYGGVDVGNYTITGQSTTTADIAKAALAVVANSASKTYDAVPYTGGNGVAYNGFMNGETASVLSGTLTYLGSSQGAINAGTYVITPTGLASNNYLLNFVSSTLTVAKAPLTLTTVDVTKVYDGSTTAAGQAKITAGQLFGSDTVAGGTFTYLDPAPGTSKTVKVSSVTVNDGNSGGNYAVTYLDNQTSSIIEAPVPPPVVIATAPVQTITPPKASVADPASTSSTTASSTSSTSTTSSGSGTTGSTPDTSSSSASAASSGTGGSTSGTSAPPDSSTTTASTTSTAGSSSSTSTSTSGSTTSTSTGSTSSTSGATTTTTASSSTTPSSTSGSGAGSKDTGSKSTGASDPSAKSTSGSRPDAKSANADTSSGKSAAPKPVAAADPNKNQGTTPATAKPAAAGTGSGATKTTAAAKAVDPVAKAKSVANAQKIANRFAAISAGAIAAAAAGSPNSVAPRVTSVVPPVPLPTGYLASGGMLPDQLGAINKTTIPAVAPVCDGRCSPAAANIAVAMQAQAQAAGSLAAPGDSFAESFHEIPWRSNSGTNRAAKPRNITSYTEVLEEVNFINVLNLFIVP